MPMPNEHAQRILEPEGFVRIRRKNNRFGSGIHAIFGVDKGGTAQLQSIHFDKSKFTVDQAKAWLKEHKYKTSGFEPAREKGFGDVNTMMHNMTSLDAQTFAEYLEEYKIKELGIKAFHDVAEPQWIPVFKTGTHTDSNGKESTWAEKDLDKMVELLDTEHHEPPVCIGHQESNKPAWAWTEALKREGAVLFAKIRDIVPEFKEMLEKKMFKKRSISVYPDGSLRHIAFLGAMPPAVKGLSDVTFEDKDFSTYESDFTKEVNNDKSEGTNKSNRKEGILMPKMSELWSKFVEWASNEGHITGMVDDISMPEDELRKKIGAEAEKKFAEEKKKLEDDYKKKLQTEKDALQAEKDKSMKEGIKSFCDDLTAQGKLVPALRKIGMGLDKALEAISKIDTPVEYSEGDDKKQQTPLEWVEEVLKALPKTIEFGEVAGNKKDIPKGQDEEKKLQLINSYQEKTKGATYRQAVEAVSKEHPELFQTT